MDNEQTNAVLDADSETPQQEIGIEKMEEYTGPEKSPVAAEETPELLVNNQAEEVLTNGKETEHMPEAGTDVLEPSEKIPEVDNEDDFPKEGSEPETDISPEGDEKSEETGILLEVEQPQKEGLPEKGSDPSTALNTEPEEIQLDQHSIPQNSPEPLHKPLAEDAPEPKPEKLVEMTLDAAQSESSLPDTVTVLQPEEKEEPEQVGIGAEETAVDPKPEDLSEKNILAKPTDLSEPEENKDPQPPKVDMKNPEELGSGEPAETGKQVILDQLAGAEAVDQAPPEAEKETEPETQVKSDAVEGVESVAEGEIENPVQLQEEKAPIPGSLSFAVLEQEQTKVALQASRTLIILQGLPGSGKSFLARAIADCYKDLCTVVSADDHGIKPENPDASANGYKALDEAVMTCCNSVTTVSVVVVVDDTNHTQDRLTRLSEIAEQHRLVTMILEPRTEWNKDMPELAKRTGRGLEVAQIQAMKGPSEEMLLPLFFGWFLLPSIEDKVRCTSTDFLKTLDTLEVFKKHLSEFTGEAEKEVDLEQYFHPMGPLHCTTKFCDYGKVEGAKEYAQQSAVQELYASAFELSLSALFVTPRTVGARVSLSDDQLLLWPDDAEKEVESSVPSAASLPRGSRAHVTLGCAEKVMPVQTGLDLLEILALQHEGQQGEQVEMELGSLAYYGEGRWLLSLTEPICVQTIFSSSYGSKKTDPTKKEPEKKKKIKCTIL